MTSWKWVKLFSHQHSAPVPEQAEEKRKQTKYNKQKTERRNNAISQFKGESQGSKLCLLKSHCSDLHLYRTNKKEFSFILYYSVPVEEAKGYISRTNGAKDVHVSISVFNRYRFFPVHLVKYSSKKRQYNTQLPLILYIINSAKFTSSLKSVYC